MDTKLTFLMPYDLYRELKKVAVDQDKTMRAIIVDLVREFLRKTQEVKSS